MAIKQSPQQLGQIGDAEITDPTEGMVAQATDLDDGGMEIEFVEELEDGLGDDIALETGLDHMANLAEFLPDETLEEIATDLLDKIERMRTDRADWENIYRDGIELLGLKIEETDEPFPGACMANHPMLIEAVTKFQAKAYAELYPSKGPVRTKVVGKVTPEKSAQAQRVGGFMNHMIQDVMTEYGPEVDRMLFYLALAGSAFKKIYYDDAHQRPVSKFIKAEDFFIDYYASDLATAETYAHKFELSSNELLKYQLSGMYMRADLAAPQAPEFDSPRADEDSIEGRAQDTQVDDIHTIYEVHTVLDLPGYEDADEEGGATGLKLPYVVTIEKDSERVLSIRRNWAEDDELKRKRLWFTHYVLVPGLGFYGYGYLHMIGGLSKTATGTLRQLMDAGTFANFPAGYKAHGMRINGDKEPLAPGEFREVNVPAMDLTKAIMPLPFKEPSPTLYNLLEFVVTAAKQFSDSTEQVIADSTNYGPVGTTMALLEASGKLFSAIHKRLHYAQAQEFKILADILRDLFEGQPYPYEVAGGEGFTISQDLDDRVDVFPVSDPNMPTEAHRIAKATAIHSMALQAPQLHDMREVYRNFYESLGVEDAERFLVPPPQEAQPMDPISENMAAMTAQPIRASEEQDHDAHLKVHIAAMNDPLYMNNQEMVQVIQAHLKEHLMFKYRLQMMRALGVQLPEMGQPLPPEMEAQISMAAAQVADQLREQNAQAAEELGIGSMMNDVTIAAQMQDLRIKEKKVDNDFTLGIMKLRVDMEKQQVDAQIKQVDAITKRETAMLDHQMSMAEKRADMHMAQQDHSLKTQQTGQQMLMQRMQADDQRQMGRESHQQKLESMKNGSTGTGGRPDPKNSRRAKGPSNKGRGRGR